MEKLASLDLLTHVRNVFSSSGRNTIESLLSTTTTVGGCSILNSIEDGAAANSGGGRQERPSGSWAVFWFLNNPSSLAVSKLQPTREEQIGNTDLTDKNSSAKGLNYNNFWDSPQQLRNEKRRRCIREKTTTVVSIGFVCFFCEISCRQRERNCSHVANLCIFQRPKLLPCSCWNRSHRGPFSAVVLRSPGADRWHGIRLQLWKLKTRWWFQIFFIFTPTWVNDPIWLIFSDGLKPPTRKWLALKQAWIFIIHSSMMPWISMNHVISNTNGCFQKWGYPKIDGL